jgi:hypothetical protein
MTFLGVLFIPAAIAFFLWRPFYLLPLLVVASVFEAGAVFNGEVGDFSFGIQPFYFVEVFILLRLAMLGFGSQKLLPSKDAPMRGIVVVLCAFWVWCLVSAFVMPRLFAGTMVLSARNEFDEFVPLQWTLSNLAQAGYLTLNVGAVVYAVHVVRARGQAEQLVKALYWAVFIVAIVGFAQFVAAQAGWDFPYELFNSNAGYMQGIDQDIGVIRRVNCTFTEPSTAGSFLAAAGCGLLAGFWSGKRELHWLLAIIGVMSALLLTTSTTGFVALAAGFCLLLLYFYFIRRHDEHAHKSSVFTWAVVLSALGVVVYLLLSTTDLWEAVLAVTVDKAGTYSFWARLAKEFQALLVFANTYGLGAGLGSNRSSGLVPTMLSTVGIVGTCLFGLMLYRVSKMFWGISKPRSLQVAFWALLTMVAAAIVGVPDLNRPVMWCLLLIVLTQLSSKSGLSPALAPARSRGLVPSPSSLQGSWEPATRAVTSKLEWRGNP